MDLPLEHVSLKPPRPEPPLRSRALSPGYRGGTWFESTAAHQQLRHSGKYGRIPDMDSAIRASW
jgi:hypothetical protein